METYFIVISIIEHPELVKDYVIHDKYLSYKACKKNINEVILFSKEKPDGFLEYGYLERYVTYEENFKYTTRIVAKTGSVSHFHVYYKMCNNFVHNNLTSVSVNLSEANETINQSCSKTINYLFNKLKKIIF